MKLLFYLAVWKRPEITEICFMGLNRLRQTGFEMEFLAVISEESMIPLCDKYGVKYCFHQNLPLGKKKNFGLAQALKLDWDYIIELGSDDLIKNELIEKYAPFFGERDYLGIDSVAFLNSKNGSCRWIQSGSVFGLGRCLSINVLERFTNLYPCVNSGLDKYIMFNLSKNGVMPKYVKSERPLTIDIKSDVNIWGYDTGIGKKISLCEVIEGLSEGEADAIRSLINVAV